MNKLDLLKLSLRNLWRRKIRTFLTIFGVIIGTSSIVIMISLGLAMDAGFQEQLQQMGDLTIIDVYQNGNSYSSLDQDKAELNEKYVSQIKKISGVQAVMASRGVYVRFMIDKKVCNVRLMGIDPDIQEAFGFVAERGRLLQSQDSDTILFGHSLSQWFYNPRSNFYSYDREDEVDVVTDSIEVTTNISYGERRSGTDQSENDAKVYRVRGVGILAISNGESDYQAYTSLTMVDRILNDSRKESSRLSSNQSGQTYDQIKVKADSINDVEKVQTAINDMGFNTYSMISMVKQMQQTSRRMQAILGGIGAISLLVAGIGITNTMVMSIYERTREIGIMKVLGARLKDIRNMFLLESGFIGLAGGIAGVLLSYGISVILNRFGAGFMGNYMYSQSSVGISLITWELAAGAILFSLFIGLLAGYSPARRAMNMPVLNALRNVE